MSNNKHCKKDRYLKSHLNIVSWNIQSSRSVAGNKFDDLSFINTFKDHHIICLQEIRQEVKLSGFRALCNLRSGAKAGGVGILYKNEFQDGIEHVNHHDIRDVTICKLKKSFFRFDQDIYLINTYIQPLNSSAKYDIIDGRDTIKKIENIINDLHDRGDVILCGDLNSRIADRPGLIENEHDHLDDYIPLPDDYLPDNFSARYSQDKHTNTYGTSFLSLVINNRLLILNGRSLGDYFGELTCIQPRGCSVVDYFAISNALNPLVNHMKVMDFTQFSDHKPLSLKLSTSHLNLQVNKPLELKYKPAPTRFVFDEDNKHKFIDTQQHTNFIYELKQIDNCLDNFGTITNETTTVKEINDMYTKYLHEMAALCFKETGNNTKKRNNNNPWFSRQCRLGKRELNKATRVLSKFPSSNFLRENYYKVKKSYKTLLKKHKNNYFSKLNRDIENGKILNWKQFKKLKSLKSDKMKFDSLDMNNFETFYTDLYSDEHKTIDTDTKDRLKATADDINNTSNSSPILNDEITIGEVRRLISSLKSGKASSLDMINNEIIKNLDSHNVALLTKLYNLCLNTGCYPWNCSVITPLHKKGNRDNPDNYRAIAVSSALGKLFSMILLERFIQFRKSNCPDPPNQLGFTKNAQTYDHILTMHTIASKYKKLGKKVFAVFVDFKKAFDSVCRQALFYKLAQNGITGKFYNILKHMYSNSFAYIKLSGHISDKFQIKKGTEQGHPLSPDLFKLYLSDLSPLLDFKNCPTLSSMLISHLLWADDLILLSLDLKTIQLQLDILNKFCKEWGIDINEQKTKTIIFGSDRTYCPKLYLNNKELDIVDSYCYLGIVLHKSNKFTFAIENLKNKAMRAFFGLKRTVNRSKLSFRALTTLFDSLIKPIVLYGAPIWTPASSIINNLTTSISTDPQNTKNIISKISRTSSEKLHLSFLKWALGVHRKASNIGTWGESGRYPLIYQSIKLTLNYYQRLDNLPSGSFVHAALQEQKSLNLKWYKNIESLMKIDKIYNQDHVAAFNTKSSDLNKNKPRQTTSSTSLGSPINPLPSSSKSLLKQLSKLRLARPLPSKQFRPNHILKHIREHFKSCWDYEKSTSSKLSYYHSIKLTFTKEPYLDNLNNPVHRYRMTKLRISAHDFEIEKGRYSHIPREKRACKWCLLTLNVEIVEDEPHVLYYCDLYADLRSKLRITLNQAPFNLMSDVIFVHNDLDQILMNLLSPTSKIDEDISFCHHYNPSISIHHPDSPHDLRPYIINALGAFVGRIFDKRWQFLDIQKV